MNTEAKSAIITKYISDNVALITAGLIVTGILRLVIFYNYFNISIEEYLDASEILLLAFKPLALSAALVFGISIFIKSIDLFAYDLHLKFFGWAQNEPILHRTPKLLLAMSILMILLILAVYQVNKTIFSPLLEGAFVMLFGSLLTFVIYYYQSRLSNAIPIIGYFILLNAIIGWTSRYSAYLLIKNKQSTSISFEIRSKKIQTNNTLIFLGATKKYLILYDKNQNESIIYQKDSVSIIRIQNNI